MDFYPKEVLDLLNSNISSDDPLSWTMNITQKESLKYLHPVRHILIMRLFCGSIKEFYKNDYIYQPFGSGPWICINPLVDHYLEECVENLE
ncbi:TnsD family Tn7-like transposition protein, partial [Bacillus pseudomycoides]|uniref:TnsD family Tn7-like transposition protein n=2 Tax=Bacillus TaxID=1386 RepID=UPI002FFEAE05